MPTLRTKLIATGAAGATLLGGGAIANAATSGSVTKAVTHTVNGKSEQALTGSTESKVRQAALAKVPGTVERVETNVDSSAPYEAHIKKSDGSEVEVQVSKDFTVAAVNQMGQMGDHDNDGAGRP